VPVCRSPSAPLGRGCPLPYIYRVFFQADEVWDAPAIRKLLPPIRDRCVCVCVCVCVCMCTYVCAEEDIPVASDIAQQPVGDLCVARTRFESPSVGSTAFVAHSGTDLVHIRANVTCIACFCTGRIHKMTMCTLDASSSCLIMLLVTDAACEAYCLSSQVIVPPGAACCTHRHPRNTGISSHATFTACIEVTDRKPSCAAVGTGYCSDGLSHLSRVTVQTSGQSTLRGILPRNTADADTQCGVRSLSCGAVETGR
jgi:hypothetical protein